MKKLLIHLSLLMAATAQLLAVSNWYWTPETNITNTPIPANDNPPNNYQQMITRGINVPYPMHIAWHLSDVSQPWGHYVAYMRMTEFGWSQAIILDNISHEGFLGGTSIATDPSGMNVYIVYCDDLDGQSHPNNQIILKKSSDGGMTWSDTIIVSPSLTTCYEAPIVAAANSGKVFISWIEVWNDWEHKLGFAQSDDYGVTWAVTENLATGDVRCIAPTIDCDPNGSYVHVAWKNQYYQDDIHHFMINYKRYTTLTSSWSNAYTLVHRIGGSQYESWLCSPHITCAKNGTGKIHVTWYDDSDNPGGQEYDVYYKRSIDNGSTWGNHIRLSANLSNFSSRYPVLTAGCGNNNILDLVYTERDNTIGETSDKMYWRRSYNAGTNWSAVTELPTTLPARFGFVSTDNNGCADFIYTHNKDLYHRGYYTNVINEPLSSRRLPVQEPPSSTTATTYSCFQVNPNPVRSNARISLAVASGDQDLRANIYDIQGRFVRNLKLESIAGQAVANWDCKDAAGRRVGSGVYLVSVRQAGKTVTGRLVVAQ
jgi:hypothetical protein